MTNITDDFQALVGNLRELFDPEGCYPEHEILSSAIARIEQIGYDNWDGGTDIYGLYFEIPVKTYATYEPTSIQSKIPSQRKFNPFYESTQTLGLEKW